MAKFLILGAVLLICELCSSNSMSTFYGNHADEQDIVIPAKVDVEVSVGDAFKKVHDLDLEQVSFESLTMGGFGGWQPAEQLGRQSLKLGLRQVDGVAMSGVTIPDFVPQDFKKADHEGLQWKLSSLEGQVSAMAAELEGLRRHGMVSDGIPSRVDSAALARLVEIFLNKELLDELYVKAIELLSEGLGAGECSKGA